MKSLYWLEIALLLGISVQVVWATTGSSFYTAGVVEFRPNITPNISEAERLDDHLQAYLEIISSSEANATDIIVFPEATLNKVQYPIQVPPPHEEVIPCLASSAKFEDFLVQLSCAARQVRKYLVVNVVEKSNCPEQGDLRPCATNGFNVYNTNVVFDREGRVIARYRKVNLFQETKNTTFVPELVTFETDFGVRFGLFICFDIMFYTPARELVQHHGITDMIFSTMFYSELPFLTAIQVQQSWAWSNNVNLLAAGVSNPPTGSTGSGIYAGSKGPLKSIIVGSTGVRRLLVAQVPKMGHITESFQTSPTPNIRTISEEPDTRRIQSDIQLLRDSELERFNSELLDLTEENYLQRRLCMNNFCCRFEIETTSIHNLIKVDDLAVAYKYRIGVYKGIRSYFEEGWNNLQICAIYTCTNDSIASCGKSFDASEVVKANFRFNSIVVDGDFVKDEKLLLMPNSLNDELYPLDGGTLQWNIVDQGNYYSASYRLQAEVDNLLTFGIYANYYDKAVAPV